MVRTSAIFWLLFAATVTSLSAGAARAESPLARAEVDRLVQPLIDDGWLYGVAVGVIGPQGTETFGYGRVSQQNSSAPDADTVFEIGSVTKVFTGLLLAQMVGTGEVRLNQPVRELLPDAVVVPKFGEREITLVDLATHTAGLPKIPSNMKFADPANPYADYKPDDLYAFLGKYNLRTEPGKKPEYSNLGMGLLGDALALRAGTTYENLIVTRIAQPLDMLSTSIKLDDNQRARLAEPHGADGNAVKNWDIPTMGGGGAIRSRTADMLRFLDAELAPDDTPLAEAIRLSQQPHFNNEDYANSLGLAWHINKRQGIMWHNGQTGGYHSFIAFSPEKKVGVVILTNTGTFRAVDMLGHGVLMRLQGEEAEPISLPKIVALDQAARPPFAGTYISGPLTMLIVKESDTGLTVKLPGQAPLGLVPVGDDKFICRAFDSSFNFERNDAGEVTGVKFEMLGQKGDAKKKAPSK